MLFRSFLFIVFFCCYLCFCFFCSVVVIVLWRAVCLRALYMRENTYFHAHSKRNCLAPFAYVWAKECVPLCRCEWVLGACRTHVNESLAYVRQHTKHTVGPWIGGCECMRVLEARLCVLCKNCHVLRSDVERNSLLISFSLPFSRFTSRCPSVVVVDVDNSRSNRHTEIFGTKIRKKFMCRWHCICWIWWMKCGKWHIAWPCSRRTYTIYKYIPAQSTLQIASLLCVKPLTIATEFIACERIEWKNHLVVVFRIHIKGRHTYASCAKEEYTTFARIHEIRHKTAT